MRLEMYFNSDLDVEIGSFDNRAEIYKLKINSPFEGSHIILSEVKTNGDCVVHFCNVTNTCSRSEYYIKSDPFSSVLFSESGERTLLYVNFN